MVETMRPRGITSLLLRALACVGGASCALPAPRPAPREVVAGTSFDLRQGERVRLRDSAVEITFAGAADSRCPSDVTCITAGDARIALLLASGDGTTRADTVQLAPSHRATSYAGYRIEALGLEPYPRSTVNTPPLVVTLRVVPQ